MDLRIFYLPSGGLAETHGRVVRLTTPVRRGARGKTNDPAGDTGRDRRRGRGRRGPRLVAGQWWLTTSGAKTTAMPAEIMLAEPIAY